MEGALKHFRGMTHDTKPSQRKDQARTGPRGEAIPAYEYAEGWVPSTDRVDQEELVDILAEAVSARNGWKRILKRCAPPKRVPWSVRIKQAAQDAVIKVGADGE